MIHLLRLAVRSARLPGVTRRLMSALVSLGIGALLVFAGSAAGSIPGSAKNAAVGPDAGALGLTAVGQKSAYFDLTLAPGESTSLEVARTNGGNQEVTALTYAGSVFTIANGGFGARDSDSPPTGATRWVRYPSESLVLAPQETSTSSFTVSVPSGTAPGQYISSIVIQDRKVTPGQAPVALDRVVRYAIAISIRVPGALHPEFSLGAPTAGVTADHSSIDIPLRNVGNQNLKPAGELTLRNEAGTIVSRAPVAMRTVFARTDTRVSVTLGGVLQPGTYTVGLELTDSATGAQATVRDARVVVAAPEPANPVDAIVEIIRSIVAPPAAPPKPTPSPTPSAIVDPDPTTTGEPDDANAPNAPAEEPATTEEELPAITLLMEEPAPAASMDFSCGVGDALASCEADVVGSGLEPGSAITLTVHSTPQVILDAAASDNGAWSGHASLPTNLEPGAHFVVLDYTDAGGSAQTVAGALILDDSLMVTNVSPPAAVAEFNEATAAALERAALLDAPVYDVQAHAVTTAAIAVAAVSLLGIVGAGGTSGVGSGSGAGGASGGGGGGGSSGKGGGNQGGPEGMEAHRLKDLALLGAAGAAWGDGSRSWKIPGTPALDAWSRTIPARINRNSMLLQRFLQDGVWARAIFGSGGLALMVAGPALVISEFVTTHRPGVLPAWPIFLTLIVIGILDSMAGVVSSLAIAVVAVVSGAVQSPEDVRTLLGVFLLLSTIPLIAQEIRPLRRKITKSGDRLERAFDYVVPPLFLAFAAAAMLKSLNGLSGLELISADEIAIARWAVGLAIVARLALEDIAAIAYPERMLQVQAVGLVETRKSASVTAVAVGVAIFIFVTSAYFGLTIITVVAAVIFALPMLVRIWKQSLPNSPALFRVVPRGFVKYALLILVGVALKGVVIGDAPDAGTVAAGFLVLMVPSLIMGIAEVFGRQGQKYEKLWLPLSVTGASFLVAGGVLLGFIVIG